MTRVGTSLHVAAISQVVGEHPLRVPPIGPSVRGAVETRRDMRSPRSGQAYDKDWLPWRGYEEVVARDAAEPPCPHRAEGSNAVVMEFVHRIMGVAAAGMEGDTANHTRECGRCKERLRIYEHGTKREVYCVSVCGGG